MQPSTERVTNLDYLMGMTSNREDITSLLTQALLQADTYYTKITDFLNKEDWKNLSFQCHSYKSSARVIGAISLQQKLGELERAAESGDEDLIIQLYKPLRNMFEAVKEELKHELAKN